MRLGCIGCGFIARVHAANLRLLDGARLVHVCDLREDVARSFAAEFGVASWSTDPALVLDDADIDGVLICTHPDSHAALAVAAARAGKQIFLEKPLATTSEACGEIVSAAAEAGVTLAVDFKFRHCGAVRAVQRAVPDPVLLVAQTAMGKLPDDSPHMDPAAGGGILENLGAHLFDLLCTFASETPERIHAEGQRLPDRDRTLFDAVTGTLMFPSGTIASFVVADTGEWPSASKWYFEVSNVETQAVISEHCRRAVITSGETGETGERVDELEVPPHEVGALAALADFVAACRDGRPPLVTGEDGWRSVAIIEAAHRSLRERAPVPVSYIPATTGGQTCG